MNLDAKNIFFPQIKAPFCNHEPRTSNLIRTTCAKRDDLFYSQRWRGGWEKILASSTKFFRRQLLLSDSDFICLYLRIKPVKILHFVENLKAIGCTNSLKSRSFVTLSFILWTGNQKASWLAPKNGKFGNCSTSREATLNW